MTSNNLIKNIIAAFTTQTTSFNAERKQMGLEMLKFGRAQVVNVEELYNMF